jgi:hypothetical protein
MNYKVRGASPTDAFAIQANLWTSGFGLIHLVRVDTTDCEKDVSTNSRDTANVSLSGSPGWKAASMDTLTQASIERETPWSVDVTVYVDPALHRREVCFISSFF